MSKRQKVIGAGIAIVIALLALYAFGVVQPFHITAGSMKPELTPGDYVVMERFTFLVRNPRRGDIVPFRADRIPPLHDGTIYPKRIVGLPGDHLRLADGKLYVNEKHIAFMDRHGEIAYVTLPGSKYLASSSDSVTVPDGHYFFLGDNSTNSLDSRACGFLSAKCILGRLWFSVCQVHFGTPVVLLLATQTYGSSPVRPKRRADGSQPVRPDPIGTPVAGGWPVQSVKDGNGLCGTTFKSCS